ncbi:class I SAM-dependent methyltransferase [Shimia abyssi]|uniref:Methyltransferase family protein n=1 Tax=Shimia abyssi TaxID=1662395 RepID=A0A2P8FB47_9RHOB|nr:class I SAM-dependent methyltransferase [Shimia abyssi]PSL18945.1 methyltransferase family protein [Shimia abyssi]
MVEYKTTTSEVAACWERNAETWTRLSRKGYDVYRDRLNTPVFLGNLPDIGGQKGLDIGCGEGSNTRQLAKLGARMTGIDVAPTFVAHARQAEATAPLGMDYEVADATALPFADGVFDFAVAFMSLMDVADQESAVKEAYRVIRSDGFFQFSILHPCFAPPSRETLRDAAGSVTGVRLGEYYQENDGSVEEWTFGDAKRAGEEISELFRVPRFHRTLATWVNMLISTGFVIEHMAEPRASEAAAIAYPKIADTRVVPMFLHVRARKPSVRPV